MQCLANTVSSGSLSTTANSAVLSPPYQYPSYSYPPPSIGGSSGGNAPPPYLYHPPPPYCYPLYSYPPPPTSGSTGDPALQPYTYSPPSVYPYPPPQLVWSEGGDNSGGGENTSHTTQTTSRMKQRNEWTHNDEENLILLNFIISLSFI
jgi:hypothetical protein